MLNESREGLIEYSLPATTIEGVTNQIPVTPRRSRISARPLARPARLLSWIGLVVLLLGAAFIYYYPSHAAADLIPDPDATEYVTVALNLLHGKGLTFTFNGVNYPSRYPFGFSLVLGAFYLVAGQFIGHAIFVVYLSVIGSILAVYLLMRNLTGPAPAVIAGATVFSSVLFRNWSQAILADYTSVLLFCLLALCTYFIFARKDLRVFLAIAYVVICAVTTWLRVIDLIIIVTNMALLGYAIRRRYIDRRYIAVIGVALVVALVPTFAYNYLTFGGITQTGYSYWVPAYFKNIHDAFALKYLVADHRIVGIPFIANYRYYGRLLDGRGTYFPTSVLILALIGVVTFLARFRRYSIEKRATLTFVLLAWGLYVGTYALYFWQSDRFLIPAVPMVGVFAGLCFHEYFPRWGAARPPLKAVNTFALSLPRAGVFLRLRVRGGTLRVARAAARVAVSLLLATLAFLGGVHAYRTVVRASYAYKESIEKTNGIYGIRYDTLLAMNLHCREGCIIVSLDDPAFVNYVVPKAYVINALTPFYEQSSEGPTPSNQGNTRYDKVRDAVNNQIPVLYDARLAHFVPAAGKEMLRFGEERPVESGRQYTVYELVPRGTG